MNDKVKIILSTFTGGYYSLYFLLYHFNAFSKFLHAGPFAVSTGMIQFCHSHDPRSVRSCLEGDITAVRLTDKHSLQAVKHFTLRAFTQSLTFSRCKTLYVLCRPLAVGTFSDICMIEQEAAVIVLDKLFNESLEFTINEDP